MKYFFVGINLLLAILLLYRFYNIYHNTLVNIPQNKLITIQGANQIKRPTHERLDIFAKLFVSADDSIKQNKQFVSKTIPPKNELLDKQYIIRVLGIFIHDGEKYAVITVSEQNKKTSNILKVGIGDKIKSYTIDTIASNLITLEDKSGTLVRLRIFDWEKQKDFVTPQHGAHYKKKVL